MTHANNIQSAECILYCPQIAPTFEFFTTQLDFKVEAIFPADNPSEAVISAYGLRLRLTQGENSAPVTLRLACENPQLLFNGQLSVTAPNGTYVELVNAHQAIILPDLQPSFVHCQFNEHSHWGVGRAGMSYRDLIPGRQGGRFIASHIRIQGGGKVADYPHYHNIRFQLIYCYKGWAKLLYEDQGEAFFLNAGDCVLQPPQIRHRVLESSDGLEVIEVGCPAEHETFADLHIELPTETLNPERIFNGQKFVRHIAEQATWQPWRINGFSCREIGLGAATEGLVGAYVIKPEREINTDMICHHEEFLFFFVLYGHFDLEQASKGTLRINQGDSLVIPAEQYHALINCSEDLQLLEVRLSDEFEVSKLTSKNLHC